MCSASRQEKEAYANEQKVSGLLTSQFQQFAGENQAILSDLTGHLQPIEDAGPSQFGMSPTEEAAERTMTAEQMNAAGAQTANAVRGAIASRGGGTSYLPSGSEDAILGSLAQDTAVKEALAQSKITERGYDIGRDNWKFATSGLSKAPGELENPVTSAGEAATGGASLQQKGAESITAANQAWIAPVAGIIGAGVKAATGGAAGGPGNQPGSNLPQTDSGGEYTWDT